MHCSKCGPDNREARKFCAQCRSPLAAKCPSFGASNEPGERFCGECGAALGTPPAAIGKSREPEIRLADPPAPETYMGTGHANMRRISNEAGISPVTLNSPRFNWSVH